MSNRIRNKIAKKTALSLLCYGAITPQVWKIYTKYKDHEDLDIKIHQHKRLNKVIFRVEFLGHLFLIADELAAIHPHIIKKPGEYMAKFFNFFSGKRR